MRQVYKVTFDRDYHTITNREWISSPSEVQDDWSGYDYYYYMDSDAKKSFKAEEAKNFLLTGELPK